MKKYLCILAVVVILAIIFFGCSDILESDDSDKNEKSDDSLMSGQPPWGWTYPPIVTPTPSPSPSPSPTPEIADVSAPTLVGCGDSIKLEWKYQGCAGAHLYIKCTGYNHNGNAAYTYIFYENKNVSSGKDFGSKKVKVDCSKYSRYKFKLFIDGNKLDEVNTKLDVVADVSAPAYAGCGDSIKLEWKYQGCAGAHLYIKCTGYNHNGNAAYTYIFYENKNVSSGKDFGSKKVKVDCSKYSRYKFKLFVDENKLDEVNTKFLYWVPEYDPDEWNIEEYKESNNCYSYACNLRLSKQCNIVYRPEPGEAYKYCTGEYTMVDNIKELTYPNFWVSLAQLDGLDYAGSRKPDIDDLPNGKMLIALVVYDYEWHWIRQDSNSDGNGNFYWSHKDGQNHVQRLVKENDNKCIINPDIELSLTQSPYKNYSVFGYFYVETISSVGGCEEYYLKKYAKSIKIYSDCSYGGYSIFLPEGQYKLYELEKRGIENNSISSIKVPCGVTAVLCANDNFDDLCSWIINENDSCFTDNFMSCFPISWNDQVSSILVDK